MRLRKNTRGSFLGMIAILGVVAAGLALLISRMSDMNARQLNYLSLMKRVHTVAEQGLNQTISTLVYNGSACEDGSLNVETEVSTGHGAGRETYSVDCARRDLPVPNVYYIVTTASITIGGQQYSEKLHSYVSISNVSEYFAAVNGRLKISQGTDISNGKVYAEDLEFTNSALVTPTRVHRAEFSNTVTPSLQVNGQWTVPQKALIQITEPVATNSPVKLGAPLLFPQITVSDIANYESLAGPHIVTNMFSGDIYPPGFAGFDPVNPTAHNINDVYPMHTVDNEHHVYYFDGDIHINGPATVHGQVLFVASGKIYIHGNLFVETALGELNAMKNAVEQSSSTAHQAILIPGPGQTVEIVNDYYSGSSLPETQTIQALIFAPSGNFIAQTYADPAVFGFLSLDFQGSMILGNEPALALTYGGGRVYSYMDSLKTNPPPYLPALSVIHNEFQEITTESGAFSGAASLSVN